MSTETTTRADRRLTDAEGAPAAGTTPARTRPSTRRRKEPALTRLNRWGIVVFIVGLVALALAAGAVVLAPQPTASPTLERPVEVLEGAGIPAGASAVTTTVDGQQLVLILPAAAPVGLAVSFPAAGSDATTVTSTAWIAPLVDAGWAVASADFHGDSWGAPASTSDLIDLTDWAGEQTGLTPSLLVSEGIGGLASLNALTRGAVDASCWYGVNAYTDLETVSTDDVAAESIAAAYRGRPLAADDPMKNVATLAATGATFRLVGADGEDPFTEANSGALGEALTDAGATVTLGEVGPETLAADLIAFAQGCAP